MQIHEKLLEQRQLTIRKLSMCLILFQDDGGIEYFNTIVVQPHLKLVTNQGKGFHIRCRYTTRNNTAYNEALKMEWVDWNQFAMLGKLLWFFILFQPYNVTGRSCNCNGSNARVQHEDLHGRAIQSSGCRKC